MGKSTTTTVANTESDSIELSKNAKGEYAYTIKAYGEDENQLIEKVTRIEQEIKKRYNKEQK